MLSLLTAWLSHLLDVPHSIDFPLLTSAGVGHFIDYSFLASAGGAHVIDFTIMPFLAAGVLAGLLAGYLGIGGGIIYVPVLFYLLPDSPFKAQIVVGTSCATKSIITLSSIYRHSREDNILFSYYPLFIGGMIGGFTGANISASLPTDTLQRIIAVVIALLAMYTVYKTFHHHHDQNAAIRKPSFWLLPVGFVIGTIAGGVGGTGGAITVPILLGMFHFPIKKAAGTSSAMVFGLSIISALVYVFRGRLVGCGGSCGFIDVRAALLLSVTAFPAAQLGVYLHRFGRPKVFYAIFSLMLLAVAIKLIIL